MPDKKISDEQLLPGSSIDHAADLIPIVDMSEVDSLKNKKTTVDELKIIFQAISQKGIADGYAGLDPSGLLPVSYFPPITTAMIADNAIIDSKLRDSAALSVIGRSVNTSGDPADIVAGANDRILRRVSDTLDFGQLTLGMAADNLWTYAKIQQVSASRLLGNPTGSTANVSEISLGTGLEFSGTTIRISTSYTGQFWNLGSGGTFTADNVINTSGFNFTLNLGSDATGDIYFRNASGYFSRLAIVGSGNVLKSGTTPSWGKVTSSEVDSTIQLSGLSWLLASGGALTGDNTISGSFNIGFTNTAIGIGVAPGSITANTKFDLRGSGASTNFIERLADGSNVVRRTTQNNGVFSIVSAAKLSEWSSTFTADSNNDIAYRFGGTVTGTNVNNNVLNYVTINPSLVFGTYTTGTSTTINAFHISPSWDTTGVTGLGTANSVGIRYSATGVVTQSHTAVYVETGKVLIGGTSSISGSSTRMLEVTAPSGTNIFRLWGIIGSPIQRFDVTGEGLVSSVFEHAVSAGVASGTKSGYNLTQNSTGATSGSSITKGFEVVGTINNSGSFTGEYTGFIFNPTLTNITGMTIYAYLASTGLSGFGVLNPTARVQIRGIGTTTAMGLLIEANDGTDTFGFRDDGKMFIYTTPVDAATGHQILLRDNSTGEITKLGIGTGLSISSGTLTASGGGGGGLTHGEVMKRIFLFK